LGLKDLGQPEHVAKIFTAKTALVVGFQLLCQ